MSQVKLSFNLDLNEKSTWLTVMAAQAARTSICYVQELGDFHCGPAYFTNRENLPSYLIKLCLDGEGTLDYEGQHYDVKPGQLFWIDCTRPQYYRTAPGHSRWHVLWVHFYGAPCEAYYHLFQAQNENRCVARPVSFRGVQELLETLIRLYQKGVNTLMDDVQASSLLIQLMTTAIHSAGAHNADDRLPGYVREARSYIDRHYAERITLDDLAHAISINKFYLQKLFKRCMGFSPNEYLMHTRLTNAKQQLRTTALPVSQIAMDVGINNIGHFISLFKRYEGITPSAYRRNWYNSAVESDVSEKSDAQQRKKSEPLSFGSDSEH